MTRTFADTMFVLALVNPNDPFHAKAQELARLYEKRPLLTTDAVLLEIGNALARGNKARAAEVIQAFLDAEEVEIVRLTPELFDRAFSLYQSYQDKDWGLIDCLSFVVMKDYGITEALTFDQHFVQAGFVALMRDR